MDNDDWRLRSGSSLLCVKRFVTGGPLRDCAPAIYTAATAIAKQLDPEGWWVVEARFPG